MAAKVADLKPLQPEGGGGINGGVVVFRPSTKEGRRLVAGLKRYDPPPGSGGEQDYLSQYFGLEEQIAQLDIAMNFQVHQLGLTAVHDDDKDRWLSLVNRPDAIACFYFSAIPKLSNLLIGNITLESEDGCGETFESMLSGTQTTTTI